MRVYGRSHRHSLSQTDQTTVDAWRAPAAADIFTKPVEKAKFIRIRMRDYIMNVHSVHSALRGSIEDAMICAVGASHRMMNNLLRRL